MEPADDSITEAQLAFQSYVKEEFLKRTDDYAQHALDWYYSLCGVVLAADHIEDGDRHGPDEVPCLNYALTQWALNPFYVDHAGTLAGAVEGAFKAWYIGNAMDIRDLQTIGYTQVLCVIFQILNGRPATKSETVNLWSAHQTLVTENDA